jgi:hypothetical protein
VGRVRYVMGLAVVLALAAGAEPATALAGEGPLQWWFGGAPIPLGNTVELPSSGRPQVTLHLAPSGATVTCNVRIKDAFTDTSREVPGSDRMTSVTFKKCAEGGSGGVCPGSSVEAMAAGLPWASHLESEYFAPREAANTFEGAGVELRCHGSSAGRTFTGTLRSVVREEAVKKKMCTVFAFEGESSLSHGSETLGVTGSLRMATKCGQTHGQLEARHPIK